MERGLYIGAGMTAAFGVVALTLPPFVGMVNSPTYSVFILWMTIMAVVLACHAGWEILKMGARGQPRPTATLIARIDRKQALVVCAGTLMLALNLTFFCAIKPQLGQIVDFTADPLLADIDHFLLGADAWRLTEWFNHGDLLSITYHRAWFLWLAVVIYALLRSPASEEKDRLLVSYVAMWSIFGPLVHLALPAAGPVFYDDLGLGNRFAELQQSPRSQGVAWYLWEGYVNKTFYPASGISAMPSLHLATMFWSLIVVRNSKWWLAFGALFTAYIFLGSIAIGWHYAIDGIVGGIGAVLCYWLAAVALRARESATADALPELSGAVVPAECPPETV